MKKQGLCGRPKGRYRIQTTDSNHDQPIAPNRLTLGGNRRIMPAAKTVIG
jgi:hypothetical protein